MSLPGGITAWITRLAATSPARDEPAPEPLPPPKPAPAYAWVIGHAYTPNEVGHYGGGDHLMLRADFTAGRLRRKAGDALCKPARQFSCLDALGFDTHPHGAVRCKECQRRAARYGFDLNDPMKRPVGMAPTPDAGGGDR